MALSALTHLEARAKQIDQQALRQIERVQYEADLARRRYRAVDPDNRLVARSLEREWNEKLQEVDRMEREYQSLPKPAALMLSAEQREHIRQLAQNLPALWDAPTTTWAQRKQLLRWLIKDVTLCKRGNDIAIDIRWQTEARTSLSIPRLKKSWEVRQTSQQVVTRIRELAPTHTETQIAALLNAEGEQAGMGGTLTASKVAWIRHAYQIPLDCPERPYVAATGQRGDGRYFGLGRRRSVERECLDHRRLVQCGTTGVCPSLPSWSTLDYPHSRNHHGASQAASTTLETSHHSSTEAKYGTVELCGWIGDSGPPSWRPSESRTSPAKRGSMKDISAALKV